MGSVQLDDALLQLLVVSNLLQAVKDLVLECFDVLVLLPQSLSHALGLPLQTIQCHAEVFLNQFEVGTHSIEVLDLLVHLGVLLV